MKTTQLVPGGKIHYAFHGHVLCNYEAQVQDYHSAKSATCKKCIEIAQVVRTRKGQDDGE